MVLELIVKASDDGYTAEVPSLKGCECWAHKEEEVIKDAVELVKFYTGLSEEDEIIVDKARNKGKQFIYKLVFDKD